MLAPRKHKLLLRARPTNGNCMKLKMAKYYRNRSVLALGEKRETGRPSNTFFPFE